MARPGWVNSAKSVSDLPFRAGRLSLTDISNVVVSAKTDGESQESRMFGSQCPVHHWSHLIEAAHPCRAITRPSWRPTPPAMSLASERPDLGGNIYGPRDVARVHGERRGKPGA